MKYYTDPSFFFNLWMQSMIQIPQNHHGHRSSKHERHRSPVKIYSEKEENTLIMMFCIFRKDINNKNYINKNLSMLQIRHHLRNLVLFVKHLKNNNIVIHKI